MGKKCFLITAMIIAGNLGVIAQNLISSDSWIAGSTSIPSGFKNFGYADENSRELGIGPLGEEVVLWKADPTSDGDIDGGFLTSYIPIDPTKTYRLAVWVKKTNSAEGSSYFGMFAKNAANEHSSQYLNGTSLSNPYFFIGDFPTLDDWYLLVAYVHQNDYSSGVKLGGIYNTNGVKVADIANDFKFSSDASTLLLRTFLYRDTSVDGRQYFYQPRIEIADGTEPTIEQLINKTDTGGDSGTSSGETVWTKDDNGNIFFTSGNVGVGIDQEDPGYRLSVKGNIHVQEVKVDLQGVLAPDYVFYEDYNLRTLEEVQNYIKKEGHLPNIPSAKEMETTGVNLKEMNLKLLEKVEELTLYTIAQQEKIKEQERRLQKLEELLTK